jgi:hypothetical protein
MKPMQAHGIYLTKGQHLLQMIDWLVKDPEAWDWLCDWWVFENFRVVSERNRQNRLSKPPVHHCGADRYIH